MELGSSQFRLWSHPEHLLAKHCYHVWQTAQNTIQSLSINSALLSTKDLDQILQVASLFHDFGKATPWFQEYIHNLDRTYSSKERTLRQHGLISAIMTYGILKRLYPNNLLFPAVGFMIVRKHHGDLEEYANIFTISDEEQEICLTQLEEIDYSEFSQIVAQYGYDQYVTRPFLMAIINSITEGEDRHFHKSKDLFEMGHPEYYYLVNLCYSILLNADKTDAIFRQSLRLSYPIIASDQIIEYKTAAHLNDTGLDRLREEIFQNVAKTLDLIDCRDKILSINAPTGSGKTITAFYAAIRLLEKFKLERIIYCLPYTSVIDQNYSVLQEICRFVHLPDTTDLLLKHHHLSEINYRSSTNSESIYRTNEALHFIEGWESRVIVTTFVQLLASLITEKNAALRKFNKFGNAVIILDEIQTIPHHYWLLVKEVLTKLTGMLNTRILLVTATMPLIFSEDNGEIIELLKPKQEYFAKLARIQINLDYFRPDGTPWADFLEIIGNFCHNHSSKNILIVMNTIKCAQELFKYLMDSQLRQQIEFLSSHIIPKERHARLKEIRKRLQTQPTILVSTQLIEVGVDIDFDIVIRDFAPLDSIFQTCGRCNREMRPGATGLVYLFYLQDDRGYKVAHRIYDSFLLQKTSKVLSGYDAIPENKFFELAYAYYQEVSETHTQQPSRKLLDAMRFLQYTDENGKPISEELKIIDEDYKKSVFVEIDQAAQGIWKEYIDSVQKPNDFDKRGRVHELRRKILEYVVNIPPRCMPHEPLYGIYHLPLSQVDQHYDPQTGFKTDTILSEESMTLCY